MAAAAVLLAPAPRADAADLARKTFAPTGPLLFAPSNPVGVASEWPRSPLADALVNGSVRFATAQEARAHCRSDVVVWVEPFSSIYHPLGRRTTGPVPEQAAFLCQADASIEGDLLDQSGPTPGRHATGRRRHHRRR